MRIRVLNLDGSLLAQNALLAAHRPQILHLAEHGPGIRLGCSFRCFRRFEKALAKAADSAVDEEPSVTFYGSGDFHHVTLALLRRQRTPVNLVVFDNHPDWMRGVPLLHCGTWLYHAALLPQIERVFHIGGDVDFDNYYRWLAPWNMLCTGKITVIPAVRTFAGRRWDSVAHTPVRNDAQAVAGRERWGELLSPFRDELRSRPLYVSLDKDVMRAEEAPVNWDSGHLTLAEVCAGLERLLESAAGNLAGMDIVGDWSPVRVRGLLRRGLHLLGHPSLAIDQDRTCGRNEETNLTLVDVVSLARSPSQARTQWL